MKVPYSARQPEVAAGASINSRPAVAIPALVPRVRIGMELTAHEVAFAELRRLLGEWFAHEPGARLGHDPEELHQLRVATRRIDATLALFKHHLPAPVLHARKTTKAVLRTLGSARDLDVQLGELAQYCATLPEQERAAAEPLKARLEFERTRARAAMVRALDAEPTRRWLESLALASAEVATTEGAAADSAMSVMPERVRLRFRKLRKAVRRLGAKASMEEYHDVRRRAKQLRYAIESGAAMFGKPADDALKALRRMQDKLGTQQDAYMAKERLSVLAADLASGLPPDTLFLMGRLAEYHAGVTTQARRNLARSWRKVRGRRWKALRARLGELSARAGRMPLAVSVADTVPAAPLPVHAAAAQGAGTEHAAEEPRPFQH